MTARIADQKNQMIVAEVQRAELNNPLKQDPDAACASASRQSGARNREIDSQLAGLQRTLVPPQSMAIVLEHLVGQDGERAHRGADQPPGHAAGAESERGADMARHGSASPSAPLQSASRHVFKHGVQVRVEGNYLGSARLRGAAGKAALAGLLGQHARWCRLSEGPRSSSRLYTLSLDKAWLVV